MPPLAIGHDCRKHWLSIARAQAPDPSVTTFTVLQCRRCGLGFTDRVPDQRDATRLNEPRVSNDFQPQDSRLAAGLKAMAARRDAAAFCAGMHLGSGSVILDYGCGNERPLLPTPLVARAGRRPSSSRHAPPPPDWLTPDPPTLRLTGSIEARVGLPCRLNGRSWLSGGRWPDPWRRRGPGPDR